MSLTKNTKGGEYGYSCITYTDLARRSFAKGVLIIGYNYDTLNICNDINTDF